MFGTKRIYAKLFHAEVDPDGPMRLNRPVALQPPDLSQAGAASRHIEEIREAILKGWARPDGERSDNQAVHVLVEAFRNGLDAGETLDAAIDTAIDATAAVPLPAPQPIDELKPGKYRQRSRRNSTLCCAVPAIIRRRKRTKGWWQRRRLRTRTSSAG